MPKARVPFVQLLPDALTFPFTRNGLLTMLAWSIGLYVLGFLGPAGLFLGAGALASYQFLVIRTSAAVDTLKGMTEQATLPLVKAEWLANQTTAARDFVALAGRNGVGAGRIEGHAHPPVYRLRFRFADGSTLEKATLYRADLNGSLRPAERSLTESSKSGDTTTKSLIFFLVM